MDRFPEHKQTLPPRKRVSFPSGSIGEAVAISHPDFMKPIPSGAAVQRDDDEQIDPAYHEAIIAVRRNVEKKGMAPEDAINLVCANFTLGLTQVAELERAVLRKYRPELMATE